jgi:hypothetical protein
MAPMTDASAEDLTGPDVMSTSSVKWDGFYAGLGSEFKDVTGPGGGKDQIIYLTGYSGTNVTSGSMLQGAELFVSTYRDLGGFPSSIEIGAEGRVGLLVTDSVAVYASAGAAYDFQYAWSVMVGGGIEAMIAESISIDVEYQHGWDLDAPFTSNQVLTSLLFHF